MTTPEILGDVAAGPEGSDCQTGVAGSTPAVAPNYEEFIRSKT